MFITTACVGCQLLVKMVSGSSSSAFSNMQRVNMARLGAGARLGLGRRVVQVHEREWQPHGVEAQQLQPVHHRCKVQRQAVGACAEPVLQMLGYMSCMSIQLS